MTHAATEVKETEADGLSHRQIVTILIGLMTGMFLAALDQTIVGTSIRTIADDLHGLSMQAWITTAYLITSTIVTPIYGKLSDIYGRKPFYIVAIVLFLIGSAASSFANSMYQLAAFRAVQGLGAGGLMSLAMTIVGDIVPPRRRAKYQGYFLAVFGISTVLGPVLGGFFAGLDSFAGLEGWRWVFLVNVPIGIIALFVVAKVLNVPHERHDHRIDWFGAGFLTLGLVPLLLVAEQGREWGWGSTDAVICYATGAVGLIAFLFAEYVMGDEALLPLRLFRNSTFSVAILGGFIVGIAMFGSITLVPQYLQIVQGYSPTEAGLLSLPLMLGIMSASIISGQITSRTGRYKIFPIIGTGLMAVGTLLFARIAWDAELWQPLTYMFIIGFGLGLSMQTLMIAVQNAGPRRDMGVSTASATFFRQIGGTTGVAVFLSILFSTLGDNIAKAFTDAGIPPGAVAGAGNIMEDSSFLQRLPVEQAKPFFIGFTESLSTVFYLGAGAAVVAMIVLMFMKEIPLSGGGPSAAAATLEGGEALLDEGGEADPRSNGKAHTNGHQTEPITNAVLTLSEMDGLTPVGGHVRRQDSSPVPAATLTLIDRNGHQVGRATTGGDGGYQVGAPGAGTYVLIISAPGHQPQASSVVVAGGPATLDVTLTGAGELAGTVRIAGAGPLPGATVTLTDSRGEVIDSCTTGGDGAYAFTGVQAGSYTLVAGSERFRPVAVPVDVPDSGSAQRDVELDRSVLLSGTARTESDRVVPDARITVLDEQGRVAAVARTDDTGRYVVSDLPEGVYTVVASGYPPATSRLDLSGGDAVHDVRLGYDQTIDELTSDHRR
ncbi:MFS transporter [Amycolatopsis suaedae]|uniref:MFS transporter n=1 Tax=Amycolatopsis suaedae TaxID=2510978 RepID=A0A4Q7JDG9_9PSEU|nr:MFS transporter [Amycolatopsis suaedae]RZQ65218.1 MFS transporter [Amycolatopsis suaedae]